MEQPSNKTIMCGVFFLDIVGYSKRSVAGQISLKERFNNYLSAAIRDVPLPDRIILDTGDGAAINFMGDVEDALKAALSMRSSMLHEDPNIEPPLLVRMGINLGPVRLIRDINGQPNIVGDGINVAQRVMGFADASQILVSRSYFDAVSRLSPQYAGMFHYQGSRTDKHVREHEVYAIGYPGDKTARPPVVQDGSETEAKKHTRIGTPFFAAWDSWIKKIDTALESMLNRYQKLSASKRALYVAGIGIPAVILGVIGVKSVIPEEAPLPVKVFVPRAPKIISPTIGVHPALTVAASSVSAVEMTTPVVSEVSAVPVVDVKKVKKIHATVVPVDVLISSKQKKLTEKEKVELASNHEANKLLGFTKTESLTERAKLTLSCQSGTLLFVDGAQKGKVSTGDLSVEVTAGKHVIIVMLPNQKLFTESLVLNAGKVTKIKPPLCN